MTLWRCCAFLVAVGVAVLLADLSREVKVHRESIDKLNGTLVEIQEWARSLGIGAGSQ